MDRGYLKRELGALLLREVETGALLGAAAGVSYRGRRIYAAGFGTDAPDTIYRVYSMTKPVTAVAVLQLYEKGLLDLWQPVSDFLPAYRTPLVLSQDGARPADTPMQLIHLMDMTSGLAYPDPEGDAAARAMAQVEDALYLRYTEDPEKPTPAETVSAFLDAPLAFEPGTAFRYGTSADVLGVIVELVSGMSLDAYFRTQIFHTLGMRDTGFAVPGSQLYRLSPVYVRETDGVLREADKRELTQLGCVMPSRMPPFLSGGTGLYSTVDDYLTFADALMGIGPRILGRRTQKLMQRSRMSASVRATFVMEGKEGYDYSNLLRILRDPSAGASNGTAGEFGWDGMAGTYFLCDPAEDFSFVFMQQVREGLSLSLLRRMRQILYAAV